MTVRIESAQPLTGRAIDPVIEGAARSSPELEWRSVTAAEQLSLGSPTDVDALPDQRLSNLSVSALVQLARCPKQFYWTVVWPLPRSHNQKARLGHDIHRWIEFRSAGQQRLDGLTPERVVDDERGASHYLSMMRLQRNFEASRFATVRPRHVEQPFSISLPGGDLVRGRIDAVFRHDDGKWEVVDYKTGREPEADDSTARLQLSIYALAARRIWGIDPIDLSVTYFYLASGRTDSVPATDLTIDDSELVAMFERVHAREFEPSPGPPCGYCDFLEFCEPGRAHIAETKETKDYLEGGDD